MDVDKQDSTCCCRWRRGDSSCQEYVYVAPVKPAASETGREPFVVLARVRSTVYRTFYLQRLIAAQVTTSGSHSEAKAKVSSKCFACYFTSMILMFRSFFLGSIIRIHTWYSLSEFLAVKRTVRFTYAVVRQPLRREARFKYGGILGPA